ncbi:hypothetical protein A9K55_009041 [Cordyceps militaris]|uniref:Uncharacterized protein n=1 Tax=Cordyceps militaris TaxID=73501 RepID=A0A2H4SHA2_CORMI|nr:hypothetical protein A9K55_009041 [Cordyceps militaris]
MAVQSAWRIPLQVSIPLSILMIIFATFSFTGFYSPFRKDGQALLFTTSRTPTDEHFLNRRKASAPWVYHALHAVPAIIWSIAMPLQHVDSVRKRWPVVHRVAGYTILSLSMVLSTTGYWFFLSNNAYTHRNVFHMHSFKGLGSVSWPTFEFTLWIIGPFYWLTIYKAAVTARAKDFARHRKWAVLHTICASYISLERVAYVTLLGIGFALSFLPRDMVHEFFGVGYSVEEMAEAELSVFALMNVLAHAMMLSWLAFEFTRAGYFGDVKGYLSSRIEKKELNKVE